MTIEATRPGSGELTINSSLFKAHIRQKQSAYAQAMLGAGFDAVLIAGGRWDVRFMDDLFHPFRLNSFLAEWLPLGRRVDHYLFVHADGRAPVVIFPSADDIWHSRQSPIPNEFASCFDWIGYNKPSEVGSMVGGGNVAFIGRESDCPLNAKTVVNPSNLIGRLDWFRAYKSEWEIHCIREANKLAAKPHKAIAAAFQSDEISEYDLHMLYLHELRVEQAELPYDTVIGLNENAAVLHHSFLEKKVPAQLRSLLIDAGSSFFGYPSDITRTYCRGDALFSDMIIGFNALQLELISSLSIGEPFVEVHKRSRFMISTFLREAGLIRMTPEECVDCGFTDAVFPHGIGHLLGVQVHDRGGATIDPDGTQAPAAGGALRMVRPIEVGQVFTIEPGVYFIPPLLLPFRNGKRSDAIDWTLIDELIAYGGIRIEDNVVMTDQGPKNLTREYLN